MNKFNLFVEKFLDAEEVHKYSRGKKEKFYAEVFVNPSRRELKECGTYCRGIIDKKGNLFVIANIGDDPRDVNQARFIHEDLFNFLKKRGIFKGTHFAETWAFDEFIPEKGVCVQRFETTNKFYLSESVIYDKNTIGDIMEIFKKAEKKNPGLEFIPDRIY